jgi:long-chain acyl-CoA synthetase
MNLAAFAAHNAMLYPNRPAVSVHDEVRLTYSQLYSRIRSLAGWMRHAFDVNVGERVAIFLPNCPEYIEILIAIWHAGLVAVPVNYKLHPKELSFILANSGANLCFCSEESVAELGNGQCNEMTTFVGVGGDEYQKGVTLYSVDCMDISPDNIAWIFYTSGTTGQPKGAVLSHRNLLSMILSYYADLDSISCRDAIIHSAPLSHGAGLYGLPHFVKGANQIIPLNQYFDPDEVAVLLRLYPGVSMFAAPTMVRRLAQSPAMARTNLNNLKNIIYGGAPMYRDVLDEALNVFGARLSQIYGQGESPMTITALPKDVHLGANGKTDELLGSVGYVRTGVEVRVFDESGDALLPGEIGEVVVRGDVVMRGYWNNPEATRKALRNGWLYTGDMGFFSEHGALTLVDRSKDVIISGGSNIYPREVEEVLLQHSGVHDVAVIGQPDAEWGESIVAFVVPHAGMTPTSEELDKLCLENLARFKRPKEYRLVDSIPYNAYGKVSKVELRKLVQK